MHRNIRFLEVYVKPIAGADVVDRATIRIDAKQAFTMFGRET
jgi:hypothetical protein